MKICRSNSTGLGSGGSRSGKPVLLGTFAGAAIGLGAVLTMGFGTAHQSESVSAERSPDQPVESRPTTDRERAAELTASVLAPRLREAAQKLEADAGVLRTAVDRLEQGTPPEQVIRDLQALRSPIDELVTRAAREGDPGRPNWREERRGRVDRDDWTNSGDQPARPPSGLPVGTAEIDPARLRAFVEEHLGDTIPEEAKSLIDTDRFWNAMAEGPRGQRLRELVETMDADPDLGHAKLAEFRATIRVAQATGQLRRVISASDASPDALETAKGELIEAMGAQFDALNEVREIEVQRLSERLETMMFQLRTDTNNRDETIARHAEERIERLRQFIRGRPPREPNPRD